MELRDNYRYEVQHHGSREGVERNLMHQYEGRTEVPHGLVCRLVHQLRGAGLNSSGVNARGSYPLGKKAPERRPEQIGPREHKAGRHLKEQQKKQQAHPDAGQRVMPNILLRFTGQERCDIGSDSRSEAGATGQNGAPLRVPIAKECPNEAPEQNSPS